MIDRPDPNDAPSEKRLRMLVSGGEDTSEVAQALIDKFKLPWKIDKSKIPFELISELNPGEQWLNRFITYDPETLLLKDDARRMAQSEYPVLIYGETGTGKELLAKTMIWDRKGSIKSVNCAGLPKDIMESELFGYEQGAFTSANKRTDGLLTSAQDGVMFMDEIGELPMGVQGKLLRAIQENTIRKVGGNKEEKINCKFVFATNRDLEKMVKAGEFRLDLYARIGILQLYVKPLRERKCDIVPIVESLDGGKEFLEKYREDLETGVFDLDLNVRTIQQLVIRYKVLGRVKIER